jgi:hypothetical protein
MYFAINSIERITWATDIHQQNITTDTYHVGNFIRHFYKRVLAFYSYFIKKNWGRGEENFVFVSKITLNEIYFRWTAYTFDTQSTKETLKYC